MEGGWLTQKRVTFLVVPFAPGGKGSGPWRGKAGSFLMDRQDQRCIFRA